MNERELADVAAKQAREALVSKDRNAMQFRAKAKEIQAELLDATKTFTKDELIKREDEMNALLHRANMVAGFSADAELARQGTKVDENGELVRLDGSETETRGKKKLGKYATMHERIADVAERCKEEFGDVRHFMQVGVGRDKVRTQGQQKLVEEIDLLTRAIIGTTGDTSGGEFLLPLTQVTQVFSMANVQQGILQRARTYNVPGRTLRIPMLYQSGENASSTNNRPLAGNIAAVGIVGEGSTGPELDPKFVQRLLTVYKYAAVTQVSDEMLGDDFTGELPAEFINAVGQEALNAVNDHCTISGTGTGQPLAAVSVGGAATIAVTRSGGANTLTLSTTDLFKMYDRHTHGPRSFWLASRRMMEVFFALSLTSSSLVTFLKDLDGMPTMRVLGYPVVLSDLPPTLGSDADLSLINPDFYAVALRQALTVESSKEFAFTSFLTTYRFLVRAGGIPLPTGTYAYKYSSVTSALVDNHSPFVYLH